MSSELENCGIRVAVGDCSVTEHWQWRPPYQTSKTVHVHAKHYKHNEDRHTAPSVCGNGFLQLSYSRCYKNWNTHTMVLESLSNGMFPFPLLPFGYSVIFFLRGGVEEGGGGGGGGGAVFFFLLLFNLSLVSAHQHVLTLPLMMIIITG